VVYGCENLIIFCVCASLQDDDDDVPDESHRLADEVGEAKGAGGGGVGSAAESKLVKDIMSRQVEQEAVGRVAKTEVPNAASALCNTCLWAFYGGGSRLLCVLRKFFFKQCSDIFLHY
jgi:hypothetical protein